MVEKKGPTKATQRTQQRLKQLGYDVAHAERKMPCTRRGFRGPLITQDLFGFIDTMAVNAWELLAIQSCSGVDHQKRVNKIMASKVARRLCYFMSIEVWSWDKRLSGKRNQKTGLLIRRKIWKLRREPLTARLLPKDSLLRRKLEQGTWDVISEEEQRLRKFVGQGQAAQEAVDKIIASARKGGK